MTSRWGPARLIAPIALVLVAIVLITGWLCYSAGRSAGEGATATVLIELIVAVGLTLLAMAWLGFRLQRRWVAPVQRIAGSVDSMAAGRWGRKPDLSEQDDGLGDIARQLNSFAEQTQSQLAELRQQRGDLTSLVDSLPDPILLTDAQERVILLNQPAARFLSITTRQALGQKLISVLGEASLVDVYESLDAQPTLVREIRVMRDGQRSTFQAVAARTSAGGVLLVLRDVSKLASAVQMKTDFVANASHELRTPIAAIKIAFETLSEVYTDDPDQTARCIHIIGGHMQRLEAMLQDLLDLSRVENAELKPEYTELRAADVLAVTRSAMGPLARNKGLDLVLEGEATLVFWSDRKLLDLILKNLVENAIKYNRDGGRVRVTLQRETQDDRPSVVLRVDDTGIGIPPQHLDRVFERFYQVDSARSGSSGRGTGLGLAIVKHAALSLGAQISIDSVVGRGTTVICVFPDLTAAEAAVAIRAATDSADHDLA